jgi:hypothetical protein
MLGACSSDGADEPPSRLLDGRRVAPSPVELEGVDRPTVMTSVTVVSTEDPGDAARACLAVRPERPNTGRRMVVRGGVRAESVTFVDASGRAIVACDGVGSSEEGARWCSTAHGRLTGRVLRDPRLALGCTGEAGSPVAQLWVTPTPETELVAVEHEGYVEVYRVAERLPVRVAAGELGLDGSRAVTSISEHALDGRLLRRYRLEAAVAG